MRFFAISDIHVDYAENLVWIEKLSDAAFQGDVLVVAGDVTDKLDLFRRAMGALAAKFGRVFFTPGNHDLWLRKSFGKPTPSAPSLPADSIEKLRELLALCGELGVLTTPVRIGTVWVVPVLSWYHLSFDTEPDIDLGDALQPAEKTMSDFFLCKWREAGLDPLGEQVAAALDGMNDDYAAHFPGFEAAACEVRGGGGGGVPARVPLAQVAERWTDVVADVRAHRPAKDGAADGATNGTAAVGARTVISFSHFLPHLALCPEKRFLYFPNLPKAVGSAFLRRRVAALHPDVHVFGHTHFGWDGYVEGVRYVQTALAYPSERQRRLPSLKVGECWPAPPAPPGRPPHGSERPSPLLIAEVTAAPSSSSSSSSSSSCCRLPKYTALWSSYYEGNARTPEDRVLAPWVRKHFVSVPGFREPAAALAREQTKESAARVEVAAVAEAAVNTVLDEEERDERDGGPGVTSFFASKLKTDGASRAGSTTGTAAPTGAQQIAEETLWTRTAAAGTVSAAATVKVAGNKLSDSEDEWEAGVHGF